MRHYKDQCYTSLLVIFRFYLIQVALAAREMAQKAFKERLKEIKMSEFDAEMYERFSSGVRRQVTSLRVVLDSLQVFLFVYFVSLSFVKLLFCFVL